MAINFKEMNQKIEQYRKKADILYNSLNVEEKKNRLVEIKDLLKNPNLWSDNNRMTSINKEKRVLGNSIELFVKLEEAFEELVLIKELLTEDESLEEDAQNALLVTEKALAKVEFQKMLGGKTDHLNAILNINAGAGGRESQDWAVMLSRMYVRWAERKGFQVEVIDKITGDDAAGIKSTTFIISGDYAFGYLKAEIGVHRLVRISPFDSNKRRHTSFSSAFITPEIDDSIDIDIDEKDLKIDTFRASGAGGQHINTTDSAIRITHVPTGIVVQCQNERSQHKNKATAMKILRSKMYEAEMEKKMKETAEYGKNKMGIDFGSQIRSYVLHPYKMVKDHRTNFETGNADSVLDGEEILDNFMENYLLKMGQNNEG